MIDFIKRFAIALIMMIFIGILMVGGKVIHAEEKGNLRWPVDGIITSSFHDRNGEHNEKQSEDFALPEITGLRNA